MEHYGEVLRLRSEHLDADRNPGVEWATIDANLNMGVAFVMLGRLEEATNYFARALRLKPDYAKAHESLGMALVELGDFAGAETHCREAVRLDPNRVRPYYALARALSGQGKSDEALGFYAEALRRSPREPKIHFYLGSEWLKRGSFDQAIASLEEAVRLTPAWAEARALLERATKDRATSEAIASYREALRLNPDSPESLNDLAWILATHSEAQFRDGAEAVHFAQRACERTAWKQTMLVGTLAAAYAEAGQFDKAVATAQKACELAGSLGQTNLLERNQQLLRLYQNRQPCREAN
jgi:tetratricopeptide (TPR) repeat protein